MSDDFAPRRSAAIADKQRMAAPFGAPVRLHISTKLGFKNPKSIIAMEVTNKWTGGYWANQGYNWFSGS